VNNSREDQAALRLIAAWEKSTHTLDFLFEREFERFRLDQQQKARVTDRVSNWARGRGSAKYLLDKSLQKGLHSIPPKLRRLLELSVCRLLFEQRSPRPLIVAETVERIKVDFGGTLAKLSNAVLRKIAAEPPPWPDRNHKPVDYLAASASHPAWMVERWLKRWGFDSTSELLNWNNQRPAIWLRWNSLKGNLRAAEAKLKSADITFEAVSEYPLYFRLSSSFYPGPAALVKQGYFAVQDPSALIAVRLLGPGQGMKILDLCAAPGGKTTLMAQLMENRGKIVAVDSSADRMKRLGESLSAAGIDNIEAFVADGRSFIYRNKEAQFDAVLLDAPCSGLGVLSRRADLRWRRKPEDIRSVIPLQRELLRAAAKNVRRGGTLVYSTCTIEPQENGEIVADFLTDNPYFTLEDPPVKMPEFHFTGKGEVETYSPRDGIDGIYAARMTRTD
jgi:16S rRNA (cytosine967-C5)-methyltransferase